MFVRQRRRDSGFYRRGLRVAVAFVSFAANLVVFIEFVFDLKEAPVFFVFFDPVNA